MVIVVEPEDREAYERAIGSDHDLLLVVLDLGGQALRVWHTLRPAVHSASFEHTAGL